jgi:hypothetical protein
MAFASSATFVAGCYTYRPLPAAEPAAGSRVSVQLSEDGARKLARQVGVGVARIDGEVLQADSTGLTLGVRQVETTHGERTGWDGERVHLPRGAVQSIQQRRLSLGTTGVLGGAVLAGLFAASQAIGGDGALETSGAGGGSTSPK